MPGISVRLLRCVERSCTRVGYAKLILQLVYDKSLRALRDGAASFFEASMSTYHTLLPLAGHIDVGKRIINWSKSSVRTWQTVHFSAL